LRPLQAYVTFLKRRKIAGKRWLRQPNPPEAQRAASRAPLSTSQADVSDARRAILQTQGRAVQPLLTEGYNIFLLATILITDLGNILGQTGWVARVVLLILLVFSIVSWGMIFQKLGLFGRIRRESDQFLRIFRATRGVANPQALASAGSPFASVYASGFRELQSQVGTGTGSTASTGQLKSLAAVNVSMQLAAAEEVRRAEKGMSWLATTAAVSPFIGLFGTVWGIIDAFSGLGDAGSATLRAVAPGISEALFTTAAGLFTAIPAVIFYNHFLQNIRDLGQRLDTFALEVAAQIEKTFT
jgi:biopolymer transport protein TolQ